MIIFSTQWFSKYKSIITRVARLPILGELIFNFKKFGHYVDRKKIVEVTPNSVVEFVSWKKGYEEVELRQHFFVRNEYALRLQSVFYPIWITFHIWDIITRPIPQLNLGFDTLTVYPDASSGATTVDGYVWRYGVSESFSTIRNGSGTTVQVDSSFGNIAGTTSYTTEDYFYGIYRGGYTFDTHELTSGANISTAILSLNGRTKTNALGDDSIAIYDFSPANNNNLVNGDYSQSSATIYSNSITYSNFSVTGYNDFTLNNDGKGAISKTGISRFMSRGLWDAANLFGGTWVSFVGSVFNIYFSDNTTNKPKLVVTYTISNPHYLTSMGVGK